VKPLIQCLFVGLFALGLATAQESKGTPEAIAKVEAAKVAQKTNDFAAARDAARQAVELDPNFYEAHQLYKSSVQEIGLRAIPADLTGEARDAAMKKRREDHDKELSATYTAWAAKFPASSVVAYELGAMSMYSDYAKCESNMKKAIALDPKYARAYMELSLIEEARGNVKGRLDYLAKAAAADTVDPSWSFYYASALREVDPVANRKKSMEVAQHYPDSERGAQALYWLGYDSAKVEDKLEYLELLHHSFAPAKFSWSRSGMSGLFEIYIRINPPRALALAKEMVEAEKSPQDKKSWETMSTYAQNLIEARTMIGLGKQPAEAVKLLETTPMPRYIDLNPMHVLKAEAMDAAGNTQQAYDALVKLMGDKPTDALQAAMRTYGAKLGKNPAQVTAEVRGLLEKNAKPATEFSLARFGDEKKVSLADYRGKVVLLNFWYPFCGPCRGEFPYLQKILDKYAGKFVILAVNVHPAEADLVLPYMTGMHWGFIPLRSDEEFASKIYQARGFPTNYLIDQEGRIVYKPGGIRGPDAQRTMELQIEAILAQGDGK
jgi:thiol-disulfide isomerase/thioredoxin